MFLILYKTIIRPHLEYGAPIWSPHTWKLATELEKVQKRATKRVPGLQDLSYTERLKKLKLPTLVYRRLRGDMINVYKYTHGMYNTACLLPITTEKRTRGHHLKIKRTQAKTNMRLHFFTNRTASWWNELPGEVVMAPSVNSFKKRFDEYMETHPVVYNYRALDHPLRPEMSVN
ncbi:hypothetical protein Bbelb_333010 [Branchiostoma belcheri]|nr:hypothetical protein Bbelb_333010 [Branchiostoma belcheri]